MKPRRQNGTGRAISADHGAGETAQIEANLRLTPWERILRHSRALSTAELLREAMERRLARS